MQFKARNSDSVKRDVVIRTVADLVTREDDYPHRADLKNPEFVVDINVIGVGVWVVGLVICSCLVHSS